MFCLIRMWKGENEVPGCHVGWSAPEETHVSLGTDLHYFLERCCPQRTWVTVGIGIAIGLVAERARVALRDYLRMGEGKRLGAEMEQEEEQEQEQEEEEEQQVARRPRRATTLVRRS